MKRDNLGTLINLIIWVNIYKRIMLAHKKVCLKLRTLRTDQRVKCRNMKVTIRESWRTSKNRWCNLRSWFYKVNKNKSKSLNKINNCRTRLRMVETMIEIKMKLNMNKLSWVTNNCQTLKLKLKTVVRLDKRNSGNLTKIAKEPAI